MVKNTAAVSNATPMQIWIARRGNRPTTPAPSHAPMVALATMVASSTGSTATTVVKMSVSTNAAALWPTLSVPGISSSGGLPRSL